MSEEVIIDIAKQVLKNMRRLVVDWREEYPVAGLSPRPAPLDIFKDLMRLNPCKVYQRLEKTDEGRKKYGLIPQMAAGSMGCIGFLPAASFCQRANSVAKDVMTDAHTLM